MGELLGGPLGNLFYSGLERETSVRAVRRTRDPDIRGPRCNRNRCYWKVEEGSRDARACTEDPRVTGNDLGQHRPPRLDVINNRPSMICVSVYVIQDDGCRICRWDIKKGSDGVRPGLGDQETYVHGQYSVE